MIENCRTGVSSKSFVSLLSVDWVSVFVVYIKPKVFTDFVFRLWQILHVYTNIYTRNTNANYTREYTYILVNIIFK